MICVHPAVCTCDALTDLGDTCSKLLCIRAVFQIIKLLLHHLHAGRGEDGVQMEEVWEQDGKQLVQLKDAPQKDRTEAMQR